jgi:hypothetical protein
LIGYEQRRRIPLARFLMRMEERKKEFNRRNMGYKNVLKQKTAND